MKVKTYIFVLLIYIFPNLYAEEFNPYKHHISFLGEKDFYIMDYAYFFNEFLFLETNILKDERFYDRKIKILIQPSNHISILETKQFDYHQIFYRISLNFYYASFLEESSSKFAKSFYVGPLIITGNPFYSGGERGIIYATEQKISFYNENSKPIPYLIYNKKRSLSPGFGYKFGHRYVFSMGKWGLWYDIYALGYKVSSYKERVSYQWDTLLYSNVDLITLQRLALSLDWNEFLLNKNNNFTFIKSLYNVNKKIPSDKFLGEISILIGIAF